MNDYKIDDVHDNSIYMSDNSDELLKDDSEIITVNNWDELQYYCSLTDKDYTLKLKENTNYYPIDYYDKNCQIVINNNVKIIGANGSYIGDSSFHRCYIPSDGTHYIVEGGAFITYTPIVVPDNNGKSLCLENITFKPMMGEYLLYYNEVLFGGIYDNRLLVKIVNSNNKYNMKEVIPYDGAKPMYFVSEVDNKELLKCIILDTYKSILNNKKRRRK